MDAFRFGGFDEHASLEGYMCGPYELTWRLVNAGLPEIWHDEAMVTWHFAHPEPLGLDWGWFSLRMLREMAHPHVDHHALAAVEAFSAGRLLPLDENPDVHQRRMALRRIGTNFEEKYAWMTAARGFTRWQRFQMRLALAREARDRMWTAVYWRLRTNPRLQWIWRPVRRLRDRLRWGRETLRRMPAAMNRRFGAHALLASFLPYLRKRLGEEKYQRLRDRWHALKGQ